MGLGAGLSHSVVYDFCFCDCVEDLSGYHEVTDVFSEDADLNPYVPKERISGTYSNYNYCFWIYPYQ